MEGVLSNEYNSDNFRCKTYEYPVQIPSETFDLKFFFSKRDWVKLIHRCLVFAVGVYQI